MTTLVALATKDAVVMGCDSLGTVSKAMVDPFRLTDFFDPNDSFSLRRDEDGVPLLKRLGDIFGRAELVPYNHMTHVDKLIELSPLPMGIMYSGISSIGNRTIKSLLLEFKEEDAAFDSARKPTNFTVRSLANRILKWIGRYYTEQFGDQPERVRPDLELIIAGYGKQGRLPDVYRIHPKTGKVMKGLDSFGIAFGGQMSEIQRLVFGTDVWNSARIEDRYQFLLGAYIEKVVSANSAQVNLPNTTDFCKSHHIFGRMEPDNSGNDFDWELLGLDANWGDFSEQNAIDCVSFFIGVMIYAQRFSSAMPTVGGDVHVALITRDRGFRFISREEYRHEAHSVPRELVWRSGL